MIQYNYINIIEVIITLIEQTTANLIHYLVSMIHFFLGAEILSALGSFNDQEIYMRIIK